MSFAYGNDGLTLSLIGSFEHAEIETLKQPLADYPIIFGRTSSGRLITLEGSAVIKRHQMGLERETLTEVISSTNIFLGAHLPKGSKSSCRQVSMRFEHLDDWAMPGGGFAIYESFENVGQASVQHMSFKIPHNLTFDALGASLTISYGFEQLDNNHNYSATRPVRFVAMFPESVPFDETYEKVVKPLQYFLNFACSAPTQLLKLALAFDDIEDVIGEAVSIPNWIETAHRGWRAPNNTVRPYWEMLLPLRKMSERVEEIFGRWSEIMARGANAIDLMASLSLGPTLYLETRFLLSVQAIEAYDRRRFDNTSVDPEAHKRRKENVLSGLPDDVELRSWVKGLLHWSNEPTLAERLERIIDYCSPPARALLRLDYVKLTKNTRNWLTHYSDELRSKAATDENLYWLTEETIVLMDCLLLRDLGFSGTEIGKLLESTRRAKAVFNTKQLRGE